MRDHTNCNHCYCIKEEGTTVSIAHVSCCKCGDRVVSSQWQGDVGTVRTVISEDMVTIGSGKEFADLINKKVSQVRV